MNPQLPEYDPLGVFLRPLLEEGRVVIRGPAADDVPACPATVALLAHFHRLESLELAGPPIPFDAEVATRAAQIFRTACRALFDRSEDDSLLASRLHWPRRPSTPSHHLSADLLFRFLPQVRRRAEAMAPGDLLSQALAVLLAEWPLSGVLASLDRGPDSPPDLGEHVGLALLYAERHLVREHPAWAPGGLGLLALELAHPAKSADASGRAVAGVRHG